jgi:phospholipid transport system substrate-binding protein
MKKSLTLAIVLISAVLILPFQVYASTAKETVEVQINKILTKMKEPAFKEMSKDAKMAEISKIINEVFDYEELSKRTLGRNWQKFSPEQQKEFIQLFSQLLEDVYSDRILAYTNEVIEFGKDTELKKGQFEVESNIITATNTKVPLNYRLLQKGGQWRVYDVVIEGVSMVKNYRTQFRQLLSKDSPEQLLETLRERVKKG